MENPICGGLNQNDLPRFTCLNWGSLGGRTVWEGLEMWPCGRRCVTMGGIGGFKVHARFSLPSPLSSDQDVSS